MGEGAVGRVVMRRDHVNVSRVVCGREAGDRIDREPGGDSGNPRHLRARNRVAEAILPADREGQGVIETTELGVRRSDLEGVELEAHDDLRRAVRRTTACAAPRVDRRRPLAHGLDRCSVAACADDLGDARRQALPHDSGVPDELTQRIPDDRSVRHLRVQRPQGIERRSHGDRLRRLHNVHRHALDGSVERAADLG